MVRRVAGLGCLLLVSGIAGAEEKVIQEADKVVVRKKTVLDFSEASIEGDLTKPEGSYSMSKSKARFKSLIKVRDNFAGELQKSVDNL